MIFSNKYWHTETKRQLKSSGGGSIGVSALIVFIIPIIPMIVNFLNKVIPSIRPYTKILRVKRIYYPKYGIDLSWGGIILGIIHTILIIVVGATNFNQQRSSGDDYWSSVVIATGQVTVMNFWLVLLPSAKSRIVFIEGSEASGVPFDRSIKYHQIVGFLAVASALVHLSVNTVKNGNIMFSSSIQGSVVPVYGYVAFTMTCLMAWTSIEPFRRLKYEIFQRVHHLYGLVILFIILHSGDAIIGFIPGIILHGIDDFSKAYAYFSPKKLVLATCTKDSNRILAIRVPIDRYGAQAPSLGSYYFLYVPVISKMEWHPFSVSSYDEPSYTVTFHIKAMEPGSFTRRFYDYAKSQLTSTNQDNEATSLHSQRVAIYGPFGDLSTNLELYNHIILVAGGIGITPMWMILEDIIKYTNRKKSQERTNTSAATATARKSNQRTSPLGRHKPTRLLEYTVLKKITLIWSYRGNEIKDLFRQNIPSEQTFDSSNAYIDDRLSVASVSGGSNSNTSNSNTSNNNTTRSLITGNRQDISFEYRFFDSSGTKLSQSSNPMIETSSKSATLDSESVNSFYGMTEFSVVHCNVSQSHGRPDVKEMITTYAEQRLGDTCIVACGPYGLIKDAKDVAASCNFDIHVENFEL